jgi:hypothetical protein
MSVSTKSCSPGVRAEKFDGRTIAPKPSGARAAAVAWMVALVHAAEVTPSWRQIDAKSGDAAMLAEGLSGGRMACVATAITGGLGFGAGGFGAGGRVVGGGGVCGALAGCTVVRAGAVVVTGTGAVVGGVAFRARAWGCRKPIEARDPPGPVAAREGDGVVEWAGAGWVAVRITRVRATTVTIPTRADVPATGMRRSRTRGRVSELDTPWVSAWPARRFKSSPWVTPSIPACHGA